jgi:flagellar biosynthesis chaperone FliJ
MDDTAATFDEADAIRQDLLVTQHELASAQSYITFLENEVTNLHAALEQARTDTRDALDAWRNAIKGEL